MTRKDKTFQEIIDERSKWYNSIDSVHCSYLKEKVKFNSHGFKHALRDGRGHYRVEKDALMRLHLLPWAPVVIRNSKYMPNTEHRDTDDKRNKLGKPVTFFELQCVVNHKVGRKNKYTDISVILRRIGDGDLHYYSVRYTKHGYNGIDDD
jgi:hypothetical protein